jgi:guanyl-specific ribonuclease Sa
MIRIYSVLLLSAFVFSVPSYAPAQVAAPSTKAVQPGTSISPAISDPGRVKLILQIISDVYDGKPLRFPKDGSVWENREGMLPDQPAGYYREYTVLPAPGSPSHIMVGDRSIEVPPANGTRGAERLIIGGGQIVYYTPNHYRDFIELRILP